MNSNLAVEEFSVMHKAPQRAMERKVKIKGCSPINFTLRPASYDNKLLNMFVYIRGCLKHNHKTKRKNRMMKSCFFDEP